MKISLGVLLVCGGLVIGGGAYATVVHSLEPGLREGIVHERVAVDALGGTRALLVDARSSDACEADRLNALRLKVECARIKDGLDAALRDYQAGGRAKAVESLVNLDSRIRCLMPSYSKDDTCWNATGIWDQRWEAMGVRITSYENLTYSGQLLCEGHALDPDSAFRSSTLFSTIEGDDVSGYALPDLNACRLYEAEFPNGPFARDVFLIVANLHKDLFRVLRPGNEEFRVTCLTPYLTKEPLEVQRNEARRIALEYYDRALAIDPTDAWARENRDAVADDTVNSSNYCGC